MERMGGLNLKDGMGNLSTTWLIFSGLGVLGVLGERGEGRANPTTILPGTGATSSRQMSTARSPKSSPGGGGSGGDGNEGSAQRGGSPDWCLEEGAPKPSHRWEGVPV